MGRYYSIYVNKVMYAKIRTTMNPKTGEREKRMPKYPIKFSYTIFNSDFMDLNVTISKDISRPSYKEGIESALKRIGITNPDIFMVEILRIDSMLKSKYKIKKFSTPSGKCDLLIYDNERNKILQLAFPIRFAGMTPMPY